MSSVGDCHIPQQHPQQNPDSAGSVCECVSASACVLERNGTGRNRTTTLSNVTTMSNWCPGKVTTWKIGHTLTPLLDRRAYQLHRVGMYRNSREEVLYTSHAGRLGMAKGSSQVSSQEAHIQGPNPMRRWSAWSSFPIPTHLHDGPINCRRQGHFFLPLPHAIPSPPFPPSQPPSRPAARQRTVSRHSLEPPVFPTRLSPLFGASSARMQAPFLHLALGCRALQPASQPASQRRFSP